jgi:valyl-tRNA synthetase
VNPKQTVAVSLKAASEPTRQIIANREMIELLATCTIKDVRSDLPPIANAATASVDGCEIFIEGLINADAEKQRLTKAIEETTKKRDNLTGRLSNEAYIAKAPPKLVEQTKEQLAAAEAELVKLTEAMKKLG